MSSRVMIRMRILSDGLSDGDWGVFGGEWRQATHCRVAPFWSQPEELVVQSF